MGILHPDYLQETLTATQLAEWEAYNRIEPVGEWRTDYHAAYVAYMIADVAHRRWGKGEGPKMENFIPKWYQPKVEKKEKQSPEEIMETLMRIATLSQTNKELTNDDIEKIRGTRKPTLLKDKK